MSQFLKSNGHIFSYLALGKQYIRIAFTVLLEFMIIYYADNQSD